MMDLAIKVLAIGMIGFGGFGVVMLSIGLYAFYKVQQEDYRSEAQMAIVRTKAKQVPGALFTSLAALVIGIALLSI